MAAGSPQSAVRLTLLMCAAETLSMTGFACFTTLLPVLMKAWGLNNSEAGLISGVFYTGYMLAVPALTSLTDRVDSRRVYLFACALSAVGAGSFAWFDNGLWARSVPDRRRACRRICPPKTLTDHLEGKAQSRATAFYTAGFGLASSVSIFASGKIGALFGWEWRSYSARLVPCSRRCW